FFFSSRRRHTRSKRDWSSDVCSSDSTSTTCPRPVANHCFDDSCGAVAATGIANSILDISFRCGNTLIGGDLSATQKFGGYRVGTLAVLVIGNGLFYGGNRSKFARWSHAGYIIARRFRT